jgi:hypothetical protein
MVFPFNGGSISKETNVLFACAICSVTFMFAFSFEVVRCKPSLHWKRNPEVCDAIPLLIV